MDQHLILLHSSAGSGRQWRATVDALQARFTVHAVDLHGHGTQAAWTGAAPMRLADEAALVEPLLERCGGAHVVGHSYGGAVALKLACRRPALVRSVAAFEPVLFGLLLDDAGSRRELMSVVAMAEAMRAWIARGEPAAAAQRFIDFWSGDGTWAALPVERQAAFAARVAAVRLHFDALFSDPLSLDDLARLAMPVLLLRGQATVPVTRRVLQLAGAALPRARLDVLPDMGHMGPLTHPTAFNRRLGDFLNGVAPPRLRRRELSPLGV
jgi:pimeloyl-ACP methyl ester carboxylesterase